MGCCLSSSSKDEESKHRKHASHRSENSPSTYVTAFEYCYIKDNFIVRLSSSKPPSIITLPGIIPENPACTFYNEECVMVAGGYVEENTSQTYIINTRSGQIHIKQELPMGIRQGNLHYLSNKFYHVGGLIDTEDPRDPVVPAPFLCYDIEKDTWTTLEIRPETERTVEGKLGSNDYLMPTVLRSPGSFLLNKVIYFVGGMFKTTTGQKVKNNSIITYNLETSKVGRCRVTLDFDIVVPKCLVVNSNKVIIAGGKDPNTMKPSKKAYLFTVDEMIQTLPDLPYELFDHAPGKFVPPYLIFGQYPYLQIYDSQNKNWRVESMIHKKHELIHSNSEKNQDMQEDERQGDIDFGYLEEEDSKAIKHEEVEVESLSESD